MAVLWPFPPNWASPFTLTRRFQTDIFRSRSGREQRRANRQEPRKEVEFTVAESGADFRLLNRTMHRDLDENFWVGDYTRSTRTAESFGGTDNTVTVEESALWMQAGQSVILQSGSTLGYREIASRAGDVLTFVDDSNSTLDDGETWAAGTMIMPAFEAYLSDEVPIDTPTNDVTTATFIFSVLPGSELIEPDDSNSIGNYEFYDGREVFTFRPNWAQPPGVDFNTITDIVDVGYGRISRFTPTTFKSERREATYLERNQQEVADIGKFFDRHRGAQREFYAPTWQDDLPLDNNLTDIGESTIRYTGLDVFNYYAGDPVHKHIMILMTDGTRIYKEVTSVTDVGGNSVVTVDSVFAVDLRIGDVVMISWLLLCRFSSDDLSTEMVTNEVGQTVIQYQSLEALAPDSVLDSNSV